MAAVDPKSVIRGGLRYTRNLPLIQHLLLAQARPMADRPPLAADNRKLTLIGDVWTIVGPLRLVCLRLISTLQ